RYGTYESNGVAFNDENEIWWMETIGGHHWMAKRVPDDVAVIMPNQFGMDSFDFEDAFGAQQAHLCSKDLREFIATYHLDCNRGGAFNPRLALGSHSDQDHVYNTPRAWYMGRYLAPRTYRWDGPDADFTPESDDIPWSFVPERKIAVEEVKELLSSNYQGTPYSPYLNHDTGVRGKYRSIGINRTGVTTVCQIRADAPDCCKGLEWICFGSTTFDALLPVYPNVPKMPKYLSDVTLDASTENFYWASRLIGAMADHSYNQCVQIVTRYQNAVLTEGRKLVLEYDRKLAETGDASLCAEANEKLAAMAKEQTDKALTAVLHESSATMKNGYNRADN
ncbi:MAG: C69 family dipeptidase, partial [Clostridia bacterium]|nr:C69 family dipeptidase [Clostridia bacterium]